MRKYYTRPCNFYYGNYARNLVRKKKAFLLAGNPNIAFDQIEIFQRKTKGIAQSDIYSISSINVLPREIKLKIKIDLKKIVDSGYQRAKKILTEKLDDLHKIAKALLMYETLSGEEIKDLLFKDIQPRKTENGEDNNPKETSALGSLGLKPKPAL